MCGLTWHLVSVTSAQTSSSLSSHCFTKAVSHCSAGTSAHTTGSYVDTSTQNSWPVDKEDEGGFNNFARVSRVRELRASSVSDIRQKIFKSWVANGQNWQNYLYKWRENNKLNQIKMYQIVKAWDTTDSLRRLTLLWRSTASSCAGCWSP